MSHSFEAKENGGVELLEQEQSVRGVSHVDKMGNMTFEPDNPRVPTPPMMLLVASGKNYRVRRSSQNYIVSLKLPIVQSRAESEELHQAAWAEAMGEITLDRKVIADTMV
ncbi:MAG: hypothetical protein IKN29_01695, partial [Bacteroidales bacterium]|nr:hypothetical protein [Bacteroidales bacterium]